ncbi:MAG TPA: hypothetical protein VNG71_00615, partial [Pyrinomonadaceae bacterium]|nr:hypothetical protein [Pyrinomonadaceae bacterium]
MKRPKILIIGSMYHRDGEQLLADHADVQVITDSGDKQLGHASQNASAVYVLYPSCFTGELIREARNLFVISASGRGTDTID